jgi:excisionase family DNA binding protein
MATKLYTTRDAAAAVGISRQTLQAWIASGEIKAPKPIGAWKTAVRMWNKDEVEQLRRLKKQIYRKGKGRKN